MAGGVYPRPKGERSVEEAYLRLTEDTVVNDLVMETVSGPRKVR